MPVEGEAPACDVLATEWKVSGIGDEPDNREKIETLRRKLYAKAKAEPGSSGAATRSVRADQGSSRPGTSSRTARSSSPAGNVAARCMPSCEIAWRAGCEKSARPVR